MSVMRISVWLAAVVLLANTAAAQKRGSKLVEESPARKPTTDTEMRADVVFWESIRDTPDIDLLQAYLIRFPNGIFVPIANARLRDLRRAGKLPAPQDAEPLKTVSPPDEIPVTTVRTAMGPGAGDVLAPKLPPGADGIPSLFRKMQDALGGAAKLSKVKDYRHVRRGKVERAEVKQQVQRCMEGPTRVEAQDTITYFDGLESGWTAKGKDKTNLSKTAAADFRLERFVDVLSLATSDRGGKVKITAAAADLLDFRDASGDEARVQLDKTGTPAKITYRNGGPALELVYSDWRIVDGIKLPGKVAASKDTQRVRELTLQDWKVNAGVKCGELGRK